MRRRRTVAALRFTGQTALRDAFLGPRVPAPDAQAERIAALVDEIAFERGRTPTAHLA
jgi:hypothetical protein